MKQECVGADEMAIAIARQEGEQLVSQCVQGTSGGFSYGGDGGGEREPGGIENF